MITIYHSEFVSIYFDEAKHIITWKPLGALPNSDWKESFEAGLLFYMQKIDEFEYINWLNDASLLKAVGVNNIDWLLGYVHSMTLQKRHAGKLAFVKPVNSLGAASVKLYLIQSCKLNREVEHGLFNTVEEAENWLVGQRIRV